MKAEELRIGNAILSVKHNAIQLVNVLIMRQIQAEPDDYDGVLLSAKILNDYGFVAYNNCKVIKAINYKREGDDFFLTRRGNLWVVAFVYDNGKRDRYFAKGKIEYLHQLQNLVFALTGEELEINLEEK